MSTIKNTVESVTTHDYQRVDETHQIGKTDPWQNQPSGSEIVRNQFLDFRHINLCSALHTLRMFLCANKINDAGAQALPWRC